MDLQIGRAMVAAGINSFAMYDNGNHSGVGSNHLAWGGESFHKMGRQKITLARLFLGCKLNLLLVDADVVILRNVMHYFERQVWIQRKPTRRSRFAEGEGSEGAGILSPLYGLGIPRPISL